jgi:transcriptional regulator GlxA family with amidase domain
MEARKTIRGSKAKARSRRAFQRSQPNRGSRIQRYRQIVNHFEQIVRADVGKFVHVVDVSRVAGVNQRTLSRAFREIHGIGPYRYLRHLRLSELKRVLFSEEITVTQAAVRLGFVELGKLGILYKKAFGESPSQTKRRRQAVRGVSPSGPSLVPNEVEETVP